MNENDTYPSTLIQTPHAGIYNRIAGSTFFPSFQSLIIIAAFPNALVIGGLSRWRMSELTNLLVFFPLD
jgi:hypothetical protein